MFKVYLAVYTFRKLSNKEVDGVVDIWAKWKQYTPPEMMTYPKFYKDYQIYNEVLPLCKKDAFLNMKVELIYLVHGRINVQIRKQKYIYKYFHVSQTKTH